MPLKQYLLAIACAAALVSAFAQPNGACGKNNVCPKKQPYCIKDRCSAIVADREIDEGCKVEGSYPGACVGSDKYTCRSFRENFDHVSVVPTRANYLGNPDKQSFFSDFGDNAVVEDGKLVLKMRYDPTLKAGLITKISSTRWVKHGMYTARIKNSNPKGIIFTWIFKTHTHGDGKGDEIDFEWTPASDPSTTQTNYFLHGPVEYNQGKSYDTESIVDGFHDYTINYQPDFVEWKVDNRTIRREERKKGKKFFKYEGRLFASIWDSCGQPKGTVNWAGGESEWCNKDPSEPETKKEYRMEIDWIDVKCSGKEADPYDDSKDEQPDDNHEHHGHHDNNDKHYNNDKAPNNYKNIIGSTEEDSSAFSTAGSMVQTALVLVALALASIAY